MNILGAKKMLAHEMLFNNSSSIVKQRFAFCLIKDYLCLNIGSNGVTL